MRKVDRWRFNTILITAAGQGTSRATAVEYGESTMARQPEEEPAEPLSMLQRIGFSYSLRSLLFLMLCVAVFSAVAAPIIRKLSPEKWWGIGGVVVIAAFALLACVPILVFLHQRVERHAGRFLYSYRVEKPSARRGACIRVLATGSIVFIALALYANLPASDIVGSWIYFYLFFMISLPLSQNIALLLLPDRFRDTYRLYENGVVFVGPRLVPWDKVRIVRWQPEQGGLSWSLYGQYETLTVRDVDRQRFDEIFRQYAVSFP